MPNHVTNKIIFSSPDYQKILDAIKSTYIDPETGEETERAVDFNRLIPMPSVMALSCNGEAALCATVLASVFPAKYTISGKAQSWSAEHDMRMRVQPEYRECNLKNKALFDQGLYNTPENQELEEQRKVLRARIPVAEIARRFVEQVPHVLELGEKYLRQVNDGNAEDWYNWSVKNWGTKWNAYDISVTITEPNLVKGEIDPTVTIQFDTAWSVPKPIISAFTKICPDFTFKAVEEGCQSWHWWEIEDKLILDCRDNEEEDKKELCIEVLGYDPEERDLEYEVEEAQWRVDEAKEQATFAREFAETFSSANVLRPSLDAKKAWVDVDVKEIALKEAQEELEEATKQLAMYRAHQTANETQQTSLSPVDFEKLEKAELSEAIAQTLAGLETTYNKEQAFIEQYEALIRTPYYVHSPTADGYIINCGFAGVDMGEITVRIDAVTLPAAQFVAGLMLLYNTAIYPVAAADVSEVLRKYYDVTDDQIKYAATCINKMHDTLVFQIPDGTPDESAKAIVMLTNDVHFARMKQQNNDFVTTVTGRIVKQNPDAPMQSFIDHTTSPDRVSDFLLKFGAGKARIDEVVANIVNGTTKASEEEDRKFMEQLGVFSGLFSNVAYVKDALREPPFTSADILEEPESPTEQE